MLETPLPSFPREMGYVDIYLTESKVILTVLDKLSKYAQTKLFKSRVIEDIRRPLRDIIYSFGIPKTIVMDREPSVN